MRKFEPPYFRKDINGDYWKSCKGIVGGDICDCPIERYTKEQYEEMVKNDEAYEIT